MTIPEAFAKLGLPQNASAEDVKKSFRKLAHLYHPDKPTGNINRFKEINEAQRIATEYVDKGGSEILMNDANQGPIGGFRYGNIHIVVNPNASGQGWQFRGGYYGQDGKWHWQ